MVLRGDAGQRKANLIFGSDAAGPGALPLLGRRPRDREFFQHWIGDNANHEKLDSGLGRESDSVLCELRAFDEDSLVATPDTISDLSACSPTPPPLRSPPLGMLRPLRSPPLGMLRPLRPPLLGMLRPLVSPRSDRPLPPV